MADAVPYNCDMNRRDFLSLLGLIGIGSGLSAYGYQKISVSKYWPDENQFFNPCLKSTLPTSLAHHEVVLSALEGIRTTHVWDSHVHLLGLGDSDSGCWVNPKSLQLWHPWRYLQFQFFLNAACIDTQTDSVDQGYVARLRSLQWGRGAQMMLLAFDYTYNKKGERLLEHSAFYTPNDYAAALHRRFPDTFEWIASIHPYRHDSLEALQQAFATGARGVKWLPAAMGIDPSSPLCDRFYDSLAQLGIPLLCHCGEEQAVGGMALQNYGNPLLLRRALDKGVKVVIAHCASQGQNADIDRGPHSAEKANFELFSRLMDESHYQDLLFGDISAITQIHRLAHLDILLIRHDWHPRLLYGSDYPLPGVIPVVSLKFLQEKNYITAQQAQVLTQLRYHNSLLFDFVLDRHLRSGAHFFGPEVFHTRSLWTGIRTIQQWT